MNNPVTLEQAKEHRYNQWGGNPTGTAYRPERCAYEVKGLGWNYAQCGRAPVAGPENLYCKQHAKIVAGRREG